jgi:hypothetical protein
MRWAALRGAILLCAGRDNVEQHLSNGLISTEPTILLRQIAMSADQREKFDWCLKNMFGRRAILQKPLPKRRNSYSGLHAGAGVRRQESLLRLRTMRLSELYRSGLLWADMVLEARGRGSEAIVTITGPRQMIQRKR